MRRSLILLALPALLSAQAPAQAPAAEVQAGLGIEHYELTGAATAFKVAPDTKIYAWSKVTGVTDGTVTFVFLKDGQEKGRQELKVPRSPYRTYAYRTFRKGDGGAWTVKVIGADGSVLGSVDFKVEIEAEAGK